MNNHQLLFANLCVHKSDPVLSNENNKVFIVDKLASLIASELIKSEEFYELFVTENITDNTKIFQLRTVVMHPEKYKKIERLIVEHFYNLVIFDEDGNKIYLKDLI